MFASVANGESTALSHVTIMYDFLISYLASRQSLWTVFSNGSKQSRTRTIFLKF